ncbi:hypothetical protein EDB86DRAFT_2871517 [Lactarius hatsudake]|nr:hypothetical protein EDB86DRAFT_2871517 [Lactarius hatsudake]
MVSKSFIAYAFLLCFTTSVNAHALISPALGVKGNGVRNDAQRPSTSKPCGNVDITQSIDTSTTVALAADGTFSPSITDFNAGGDGSRDIKTVQVDASGTGKKFVAAKMIVNGDANPTSTSTQQLKVQLPSGTTCTGGAGKNLCLASFVTTGGFGNCVVVSQAQAGAPSNPPSPAKNKDTNTNNSPAAKGGKQPSPAPPVLRAVQPAETDGQTETPGSDKRHHRTAGAGAGEAIRRTASFRRNWSSRE